MVQAFITLQLDSVPVVKILPGVTDKSPAVYLDLWQFLWCCNPEVGAAASCGGETDFLTFYYYYYSDCVNLVVD